MTKAKVSNCPKLLENVLNNLIFEKRIHTLVANRNDVKQLNFYYGIICEYKRKKNKVVLTVIIIMNLSYQSSQEGGSVSPNLMRVSVPIVSKSTCQQVYQSMNTITDRMICAGYTAGGKDSCQGDSGGPLTSSGVLYGIVSWGRGCAQPRYPGVYSNVANLRSWIKTNSGV